MDFCANSSLLWTDSLIKSLPGSLSSVQVSFFPGKGSFSLTPLVKYSVTLQLPPPRRDCGPESPCCFFSPLNCKNFALSV